MQLIFDNKDAFIVLCIQTWRNHIRKPSTPVKVKVRVGRKTAEIEYDPTRTSSKDLDALIKTLNKSLKK